MVAIGLSVGTQAQLGGLVRQAVKAGVEQRLGVKKTQPNQVQNQESVKEDEDHVPTPEEVMAMVPPIPQPQRLAEYACEQHRANPRALKMLANPTTSFFTQMMVATASGYVVMMGGAKAGSVYNFDEQLLNEFGISQEKYEAMSEEEQRELANRYATELQERYLSTAERLASDEGYNKLMDQYMAIENEIQKRYDEVDSLCREMWQKNYGDKENRTESDVCEYFKMAMPMQHATVIEVMKMRKARQLEVAKKMDEYVQKLAKLHPTEIYSGFYNQGGICATAYVTDAARLTTLSEPR